LTQEETAKVREEERRIFCQQLTNVIIEGVKNIEKKGMQNDKEYIRSVQLLVKLIILGNVKAKAKEEAEKKAKEEAEKKAKEEAEKKNKKEIEKKDKVRDRERSIFFQLLAEVVLEGLKDKDNDKEHALYRQFLVKLIILGNAKAKEEAEKKS